MSKAYHHYATTCIWLAKGWPNAPLHTLLKDADSLHMRAGKLHRIAENHCNGMYVTDDDVAKAEVAEKWSLEEAAFILAKYGYRCEHQTDPRGWPIVALNSEGLEVFRVGPR